MQTHCASQPPGRGKRDESNISLYACRRIGQADVSWTHAAPATVNCVAVEGRGGKGGERKRIHLWYVFQSLWSRVDASVSASAMTVAVAVATLLLRSARDAAAATHLSSNHLQRRQLISWLGLTTTAATVISLGSRAEPQGSRQPAPGTRYPVATSPLAASDKQPHQHQHNAAKHGDAAHRQRERENRKDRE